ncbi:ComEC/Rec2 family competence protein [uncultured Draconibacterium sp.]|uniref:ComEC/Rec2 family competence protein n=1 Tax=uncultured Draconibacterium sp. TaxID=1573823 RepID=UPI003216321E
MENTFQKIPFLRIALAFAIGIVVGNQLHLTCTLSLSILATLLFLLAVTHLKYRYQLDSFFGLTVHLFFIVLGVFIVNNYNSEPRFHKQGIFVGTILETPQEKENSYRSTISLSGVKSSDSLYSTNEKMLVYFPKKERLKTLKPGSTILFETTPRQIENYGNPYEFNYKNYLQNKRIYRQAFLSEEDWAPTPYKSRSIRTEAELLREHLLKIYHRQNLRANETEILSALTLGYKQDLDPETKRIFSAAGAMHVLAVSGLHVGIIFMVYSFFFGFLRKRKTSRFIFIVAGVLLLWTYAGLTGFSPSVMRAATMFSIVIIGTNLNRRANIYNSLAASALILLLINPNYLFEVGFQLSYSAVFGIVFLQPKLEKLLLVNNKILKFIWSLFCVSLAAQITTFPLTVFYFNQFPTFFWLSNIVIIPAVTLLIPLGLSLLIFSKITLISNALSFLVGGLIRVIYIILENIESLPYSTLNISLHSTELLLLILFLFFTFLFVQKHLVLYLKTAGIFLFAFTLSIFLFNLSQHHKREMYVLNNSQNPSIMLIAGRTNYVISKTPIAEDDFLYRNIQNIKNKKRLNTPVFLLSGDLHNDQYLLLQNGLLFFEGKSLCLNHERLVPYPNFSPDYIIAERNFKFEPTQYKNVPKLILTNQYRSFSEERNIFSVKLKGAFYDKWNSPKNQITPHQTGKNKQKLAVSTQNS